MRLFLASRLSAPNRHFFSKAIARLIEASQGAVRPVPRDSEHLTHLFLGAKSQRSVEKILTILAPTSEHPGFPICLGRTRVLYGRAGPRVLYAELVEGASRLSALAETMRQRLQGEFPELAGLRLKMPHVTLARFRRGATRRDGRVAETLLEDSSLAEARRHDKVEKIELISSVLTDAGPIYETVGEIVLGTGVLRGLAGGMRRALENDAAGH